MSRKIHSQDSNCKGNCKCSCITSEDAYASYKEAAESDAHLFGDYDYCKEWMNDTEGL